jgi:hypothetical protein
MIPKNFIQQLLLGDWQKSLSALNYAAVSDWLRKQSEEAFVKFIFYDDLEKNTYVALLGCQPAGNSFKVTRFFVPKNGGMEIPAEVKGKSMFCLPFQPIWESTRGKLTFEQFSQLEQLIKNQLPEAEITLDSSPEANSFLDISYEGWNAVLVYHPSQTFGFGINVYKDGDDLLEDLFSCKSDLYCNDLKLTASITASLLRSQHRTK